MTLWQARNVLSLSSTCKRFRKIVTEHSAEIFGEFLDVGLLIYEIAGDTIGKAAVTAKRILSRVPKAILESCRRLSLTEMFVPSVHQLAMAVSMPNLEELGITISHCECDDPDLASLVPAEKREWFEAGKRITLQHAVKAMEELKRLRRLRLAIDHDIEECELGEVTLLPTVDTLSVFSPAETGLMFARPMPSIRELTIHNPGSTVAAINACAGMTSLKFHSLIKQEDLDEALKTCHELRSLQAVGSVKLSLAKLEADMGWPWLTTITLLELEPGSVEILSRCCPMISDFSLWNVMPSDVEALGALKHLEKVHLRTGQEEEGDGGRGTEVAFSEAFTKLGRSEGAAPFKSIHLYAARFDLMAFFASRRCKEINEAEFNNCRFAEDSMDALGRNARESLTSLCVHGQVIEEAVALVKICERIEKLETWSMPDSVEVFRRLGEGSKSPIREAVINLDGMVDGEAVQAISPALRSVVDLKINCPDEALLELIGECPSLQSIRLKRKQIKRLRGSVPNRIDLTVF